MLRWVATIGMGMALGAFAACADDYDCGERDLPGTAGCPCLPGDRCAEALVCAAGVCVDESPKGTSSTTSTTSTGTDGTSTGSGTTGSGGSTSLATTTEGTSTSTGSSTTG